MTQHPGSVGLPQLHAHLCSLQVQQQGLVKVAGKEGLQAILQAGCLWSLFCHLHCQRQGSLSSSFACHPSAVFPGRTATLETSTLI